MKQIQFYAVGRDILSVLEVIERDISLRYVRTGNATNPDFDTFLRGSDIPNLGTADRDTGSTCAAFLVVPTTASVVVRNLRGVDGIQRYCMDQLINPDTVVFTPAGVWGNDLVLNGQVGTASDSTGSLSLLKLFTSAFRQLFVKVRAYWVGPQALDLLKQGKRLTISAQSPRAFDLTIASR